MVASRDARSRVARRDRRGMALIFVLWMLVLLGLAISELVARARDEASIVATLRSRAVARYAAESGVLITTAALQTLLDSASDPEDLAASARHLDTLGRQPADLAGHSAQFAVTVANLNARLDLARSDTFALRSLFAQFVPAGRAAEITAALRDDPVTRFSELARVPGADDALALAVAPYVTVSSDGLIDVNAAPEAVLAALPGIGPAKARAIVARRDGGEVLASADEFRATQGRPTEDASEGSSLTVAPTRIMIVSRGWQRGMPLSHEIQAVYVVLAGSLTLQSWEERDR
jgi:general secretion pathway protein K